MPDLSPERYEAGTLPTPAIAGVCEGLRAVRHVGTDAIARHERELYRRARDFLGNQEGVTLYAPEYEGSTLLFNLEGIPSDTVGSLLNEAGILVRSGYHCSALGHRTLGTPNGGAVRVSFGMYNHIAEVDAFAAAIRRIWKERSFWER